MSIKHKIARTRTVYSLLITFNEENRSTLSFQYFDRVYKNKNLWKHSCSIYDHRKTYFSTNFQNSIKQAANPLSKRIACAARMIQHPRVKNRKRAPSSTRRSSFDSLYFSLDRRHAIATYFRLDELDVVTVG